MPPIHKFNRNLSLKANWKSGSDLEYAAWQFAGHKHREQFRNSGQNPQRSAWLKRERRIQLQEALQIGELVAFGIQDGEAELRISQIPEIVFQTNDLNIDWDSSRISALGEQFRDIRVCHTDNVYRSEIRNSRKLGRPSQLAIILEAWNSLKGEIPGFLEMAKSTQNREIQGKLKADYPSKFPGNSEIGESTIRRHRRENPNLFD